jgi:hypothetical protein
MPVHVGECQFDEVECDPLGVIVGIETCELDEEEEVDAGTVRW